MKNANQFPHWYLFQKEKHKITDRKKKEQKKNKIKLTHNDKKQNHIYKEKKPNSYLGLVIDDG